MGTGIQYINTGFTQTSNTKAEAKAKTYNNQVCIPVGNYPEPRFTIDIRGSNVSNPNLFGFGYGDSGYVFTDIVYNNEIVVASLENGLFVVDGKEFLFDKRSNNGNSPICILKNGISGSIYYGYIYYVKIWDNDVLVRNFIPCYRKSDSEIGMYDTVTKEFFTNQGTGKFLKGPDVD